MTYTNGSGGGLDAQSPEEGSVPGSDRGCQGLGRIIDALEVRKCLCGITTDQGREGRDGRGKDEKRGEVDHFGRFVGGS